ncbi:MAG: DNA-3-methyladenine glycosylase [Gammaproteobacteria bacterium]|nr:DNA-3-methyladenine glycosylase [Gammaproteobacteria bacterium]
MADKKAGTIAKKERTMKNNNLPLVSRCPWCGDDPLYVRYHDEEWGKPLYDKHRLFEFLVLESFQAGLSWRTILYKREAFRAAFDNFAAEKIASYDETKIQSLLADSGIIRNQRKILATIRNARAYLQLQQQDSFSEWLWSHVNGKPQRNQWQQVTEIPAHTPLAEKLALNLKKAGFQFLGPTTVYAFMQATGMVNDHLVSCDWHEKD